MKLILSEKVGANSPFKYRKSEDSHMDWNDIEIGGRGELISLDGVFQVFLPGIWMGQGSEDPRVCYNGHCASVWSCERRDGKIYLLIEGDRGMDNATASS